MAPSRPPSPTPRWCPFWPAMGGWCGSTGKGRWCARRYAGGQVILQRARSDSVAQPSRRQPPRARAFFQPRGRLAGTPGGPGPHRPRSHGPGTRSRKPPARMGPGGAYTQRSPRPSDAWCTPTWARRSAGPTLHGSKLARSTGPPGGRWCSTCRRNGAWPTRPPNTQRPRRAWARPGRMAAAFTKRPWPQPHQRRVGEPAGSKCAVDQPLPADRCRQKAAPGGRCG